MPAFKIRMTADLDDVDVRRFATHAAKERPSDVPVSAAARTAAEEKLVRLAKDLSFSSKREMSDCIKHVAETNPALLRLSRAHIAERESDAVVVMADEE